MLPNNHKSVLLLAFAFVQLAHAQSVGSRPVIAGTFASVLPLADGGLYLAGTASDLRAIPLLTSNAVRIRLDQPTAAVPFFEGTGFDGPVSVGLAVSKGQGAFLYGGDFGSFNQQNGTARLVKIKADGTRDASFGVGQGFDAAVATIANADDGSGDFWVGGQFTKFDGQPVASGLVRISASGKLVVAPDLTKAWPYFDDSGPIPAQVVLPLVDGSGGVIVGSSGGIIKLAKNGSVDKTFSVPIQFSGNRVIIDALVRTDGGILIGGAFETATTKNLIKIKETGELDPSFQDGAGTDGEVRQISIVQDSSDMIYLLGKFAHYDGNFGGGTSSVVRINPNGLLDPSFKADFIGGSTMQTLPNGNIAIASAALAIPSGNSIRTGGFTTADFAVLDSSGARLPGFKNYTIESDREITTLVPMQDGSLVVGGTFTYYGPTTQLPPLVHLNADGSVDAAFEQNLASLVGTPYAGISHLAASLRNPNLFFATGQQFFSFDPHGKVISKFGQGYIGWDNSLAAVSDGTVVNYGAQTFSFLHEDLTVLSGFKLRAFDESIDSDSTNEQAGTIKSVVDAGQDDGSVWVAGDFNYYDKSKTGSVVRIDQNGEIQDRVQKLQNSSRIASSPDQETFWIDNITDHQLTLNRMDNDGSIRKSFAPSIDCGDAYGYSSSFQVRQILAASDRSVYLLVSCVDNNGRETGQTFQHFKSDGTEDKDFATRIAASNGTITEVAQVPKSTDLVLVGNFTRFGSPSLNRPGLVRVRADGTVVQ